jgi:hypothetical protein
VLFNVKYLVLTRNITVSSPFLAMSPPHLLQDSALAVLGRKMSVTVDANLRAFEQNLVYLQAALQGIPCHKLFFASFEQVRLSPEAYIGPLVEFLELKTSDSIAALSESLRSFSNKNKALKSYPLLPQPECGQKKEKACYDLVSTLSCLSPHSPLSLSLSLRWKRSTTSSSLSAKAFGRSSLETESFWRAEIPNQSNRMDVNNYYLLSLSLWRLRMGSSKGHTSLDLVTSVWTEHPP